VAWALISAGAVVYALRSAWRWLAVLHPAMTTAVVVATGNHYWADAIVAAAICAASTAAVAAVGRVRLPARTSPDYAPTPHARIGS
jgi:hypothetical protein